jgi:hypothetical protein
MKQDNRCAPVGDPVSVLVNNSEKKNIYESGVYFTGTNTGKRAYVQIMDMV